jgi:predicted Rossmann fold nucleotide-binding protein DprA/Smf involved in DNA uptake
MDEHMCRFLEKDEQALLKNMPRAEIGVEQLIALTSLAPQHLNALLMGLLLKGAIKELPGRLYKKIWGISDVSY